MFLWMTVVPERASQSRSWNSQQHWGHFWNAQQPRKGDQLGPSIRKCSLEVQFLCITENESNSYLLPARQKNFVNIFSCLPRNFALKNGGDFWWIFSGLRLPRIEARKVLEKFGENSEQNSGQNSGRKFEKFGKLSFCHLPDLTNSEHHESGQTRWVDSACQWTEKAHKLFQHELSGPTPKHPNLGSQKKFWVCLFSWERTQKGDPHKHFQGDLGGQKGSPKRAILGHQKFLVNLFLTNLVRISEFSSLFPAIAVFWYALRQGCWKWENQEKPEIFT